eukprot:jgi/Ulvmu1/3392/UM016_0008.1
MQALLRSHASARAALAALVLLCAALPCHAQLPLPVVGISVGGRTPRTRPARPARAPRAAAGGTSGSDIIIAPPPEPAVPIVEPDPSDVPTAPPTDAPSEEGDLRLVSRVDINGFATGALQVFHNGAFGAVCDNQFGPAEADVACRQLGFIGGADLPLAIRGNIPTAQQRTAIEAILAPMVLENVACNGTEARLVDCAVTQEDDYGFDYDYVYTYYGAVNIRGCSPLHTTYAFVACGTATGPGMLTHPPLCEHADVDQTL